MSHEAVETVIETRARNIGSFAVGRVLPAMRRRAVGPFVFLDHMGPVDLPAGAGFDVPPHPHIGLCTVTYLFEGEAVHRDSLGVVQVIRPGDINWMTAGRGIVHSERSAEAQRTSGGRLHGLQLWVALPHAAEEMAPEFHHHAAASLPELEHGGARLRLLAGSAYGATSPVKTCGPLFYVEAFLPSGASLTLPDEYAERAAYLVEGAVTVGEEAYDARRLLVFAPGTVAIRAVQPSRVVLIGGPPLDGPRHIWWNFVSSQSERIEQAKRDWNERLFPAIPGDDQEFVPLPE